MSKDIPKYHISESAFPHYNCKTRSDQVFTSTYNSQLTPMSLQTALVTPRQSLTWNSGDNLASHHFNRRVNSPRLWRPSLSPRLFCWTPLWLPCAYFLPVPSTLYFTLPDCRPQDSDHNLFLHLYTLSSFWHSSQLEKPLGTKNWTRKIRTL